MFFILSKVFWFVIAPLNVIILVLALAAFLSFTRFRRTARFLLVASVVVLISVGFTRLGDLPLIWLEERYQSPEPLTEVDGIIILGGGIGTTGYHHEAPYYIGSWADRVTTGLALKQRFPNARLIYSGGSGRLAGDKGVEARAARQLVIDLYGDDRAMDIEGLSRSTWENGVETMKMIGPGADPKRWVLVTSSWHMLRAMGVYRKLGFEPVPYPTDYKAAAPTPPYLADSAVDQWDKFQLAIRELVGLAAYWATGRWQADAD